MAYTVLTQAEKGKLADEKQTNFPLSVLWQRDKGGLTIRTHHRSAILQILGFAGWAANAFSARLRASRKLRGKATVAIVDKLASGEVTVAEVTASEGVQ